MILTLKELADYLKVHERTVLRMLKNGQLRGAKIGGQWRFNSHQIAALFFPSASTPDFVPLQDLLRTPLSIPVSRILKPTRMVLEMTAATKDAVLDALTLPIIQQTLVLDGHALTAALRTRESLLSTAVGKGIAIPHPRDPIVTLREPAVLVLGRASNGVDYGAFDSQPVDLFFLLCCQTIELHLHLMGRLAQLLRDHTFISACRQAPDTHTIVAAALAAEQRVFLE